MLHNVTFDGSINIWWLYHVFPPLMTGLPLCEPYCAPSHYGYTHSDWGTGVLTAYQQWRGSDLILWELITKCSFKMYNVLFISSPPPPVKKCVFITSLERFRMTHAKSLAHSSTNRGLFLCSYILILKISVLVDFLPVERFKCEADVVAWRVFFVSSNFKYSCDTIWHDAEQKLQLESLVQCANGGGWLLNFNIMSECCRKSDADNRWHEKCTQIYNLNF